jgi:hypothetical protein
MWNASSVEEIDGVASVRFHAEIRMIRLSRLLFGISGRKISLLFPAAEQQFFRLHF